MKFLNIKLVSIILLGSLVSLAQSPEITELEYYFDTDPGFGNGTSVSVVTDSITSTTFNINIAGLTPGFHKVYFRVRDENLTWSIILTKNVVKVAEDPISTFAEIVSMEYFFDTDPGFGNGIPIAVTLGTITSTTFDIDISGLDVGFHKVYFRTKNENEVWSLSYIQNLVKVSVETSPEATDIIAMEYFIDVDPGFGNGTDVPITADSIIDETFIIDISSVSPHDHNLYVRVMDENNNWSMIVVDTFNIASVELTAYLEGPFSGGSMSTNLNSNGNLPLAQPFNVAPWNYSGDEYVVSIPNTNIIDWILMEVRNSADPSTATPDKVIFRKAAFILNDGSIVDLDGYSNLEFKVHVDENNFVVIYHRNHLGIMSATDLSYSGWVYGYDFTTGSGQVYLNGQKDLGGGVYGLIGGNANSDGTVNQLDLNNRWDLEVGESGYYSGDMNMNSEVDNEDKNQIWFINQGSSSAIPE